MPGRRPWIDSDSLTHLATGVCNFSLILKSVWVKIPSEPCYIFTHTLGKSVHNLRVVMLLENASSLTRIHELKKQLHINEAAGWTCGGIHYYIFVKVKNKKSYGTGPSCSVCFLFPSWPISSLFQGKSWPSFFSSYRLFMAPGSKAGAALSFPNS